MFTPSNTLLSIGLILDIIGVIIMYMNSPKVTYDNVVHNHSEYEELNRKARAKHRNTKLGLAILAVGFSLQFVAIYLK